MPGKYKSDEIKTLIVEAKLRGETNRDIAERYHVGTGTVSRIWTRWESTRSVKNKKKSGRPRKTTAGQARLLVRQVKKDPFMTAVDVKGYAEEHLNLNISEWTARRILVRNGLEEGSATRPSCSERCKKSGTESRWIPSEDLWSRCPEE